MCFSEYLSLGGWASVFECLSFDGQRQAFPLDRSQDTEKQQVHAIFLAVASCCWTLC